MEKFNIASKICCILLSVLGRSSGQMDYQINRIEGDNHLWLIGTVVSSILLVILIVLVSVCICSKKKTVFIGVPLRKSTSDESQANFDNNDMYANR